MSAFNTLTHIVGQKDFRHLSQLLKDAKVFCFGQKIGYRVYKTSTTPMASVDVMDVGEHTVDQWLLPFPTTCISYDDCATILTDKGNGRYDFVTYVSIHVDTMGDAYMLLQGYIDLNKSSEMDLLAGHVNTVHTHRAGGKLEAMDASQVSNEFFLLCIVPSIKGLVRLNCLDRFIMEIAPANKREYSAKYIPMIEQRPTYILLYPHEIRKYMRTEHETTGKRAGHERRAHLRQYPDDITRYPKAHGRVVRIPSTWIGSTEKVVGDKKYRVVLDYYVDQAGNIK
jgi:hypothetical protein